MSSPTEEFAQLSKCKSESTKLFMQWAISGATGWCAGVLKHVATLEIHFGIDTIDEKDFLFVINVHFTYGPRFRFLDNREAAQLHGAQRKFSEFGKVLEVTWRGHGQEENGGKVVFAELFPDEAISV